MSDFPDPLTPPDCDLRGMPLPFELLEAFAAEWGAPIEAVIAVAIDAGFDVETRT